MNICKTKLSTYRMQTAYLIFFLEKIVLFFLEKKDEEEDIIHKCKLQKEQWRNRWRFALHWNLHGQTKLTPHPQVCFGRM